MRIFHVVATFVFVVAISNSVAVCVDGTCAPIFQWYDLAVMVGTIVDTPLQLGTERSYGSTTCFAQPRPYDNPVDPAIDWWDEYFGLCSIDPLSQGGVETFARAIGFGNDTKKQYERLQRKAAVAVAFLKVLRARLVLALSGFDGDAHNRCLLLTVDYNPSVSLSRVLAEALRESGVATMVTHNPLESNMPYKFSMRICPTEVRVNDFELWAGPDDGFRAYVARYVASLPPSEARVAFLSEEDRYGNSFSRPIYSRCRDRIIGWSFLCNIGHWSLFSMDELVNRVFADIAIVYAARLDASGVNVLVEWHNAIVIPRQNETESLSQHLHLVWSSGIPSVSRYNDDGRLWIRGVGAREGALEALRIRVSRSDFRFVMSLSIEWAASFHSHHYRDQLAITRAEFLDHTRAAMNALRGGLLLSKELSDAERVEIATSFDNRIVRRDVIAKFCDHSMGCVRNNDYTDDGRHASVFGRIYNYMRRLV